MKRKGFTLIELLAVIVILAIIAVIATPIIVGIIEDSRKKSAEVGVSNYIKALEHQIAIKNLNERFNPSKCELNENTLICDNEEVEISVSGVTPENGYVILENGKVIRYSFVLNGNTVTNETPLNCFTLEKKDAIYEIVDYSNNCPKDVVIPKYNGEQKYLDMYEIIDITFDMNACKEDYMENTADAIESDATTTCQNNLHEFEFLKSAILETSNYSLESRNKAIERLSAYNDLIYSESKVPEKNISEYDFDMNKCKNYISWSFEVSEEEAINICKTEGKPHFSSITVEEIETAFTNSDFYVIADLISVGNLKYSYPNAITTIKENAFNGKELVHIDLSENIESVADKSFCGNYISTKSKGYEDIVNLNFYAFCEHEYTDTSCFEYRKIYDYELDKEKCINYLMTRDEYPYSEDSATEICNNEEEWCIGQCYRIEEIITSNLKEDEFYELLNNEIITPTSVDPSGISIEGYKANCPKQVVIPDEIENLPVKVIYDYAFVDTRSNQFNFNAMELQKVYLSSNINYIGKYAFALNNISKIRIPSNVKTLAEGAFAGNQITDVYFDEGIEIIGRGSFVGNLINYVEIPTSVRKIDWGAFGSNAGYLPAIYTNNILSVIVKGKSSLNDFEYYSSGVFAWAEGLSDDDIEFTNN